MKKNLKKVSIVIISISFLGSLLVLSSINAFELGYDAAVEHNQIDMSWKKEFSHGNSPGKYGVLNTHYTYLVLYLFILLAAKFIKHEVISQVICSLMLVLIICSYWLSYKVQFVKHSAFYGHPSTYYKLINISTYFDILLFTSLFALFVLQIFSLYYFYQGKKS